MGRKADKVTPCPYCARPELLDAPKGRPTEETWPVVNYAGRFWGEAGPPSLLHARQYGERFVAEVPPGHFAERFDGFSARLVGVEIGFRLADVPPPFSNLILTHLSSRRPLVPSPFTGSAPTVAYVLFSGCVLEHDSRGVEVRAHWWPSHGWIINQRVTLTAEDPAGRNAQLEAAHAALDFFLMETRGAQKIMEADIRAALGELGPRASQRAVAARLGVSETALEKWRRARRIQSWREVKERFADA